MKVGLARSTAARWVAEHAAEEAWFRGAYFSGSTVGMPDDRELAATSDVDVMIVTAETQPPLKPGKFVYRGVLLEVSYVSWDQLASAQQVLSSYHLAGGFRRDTIIADPTGRLRELHAQVSRHFADREWVRRRCMNAREKIENGLSAVDASAPWHTQVMGWLFPTGVTTHVLLVAALRNPTVRLRYVAAREVLSEYGRPEVHEDLLKLLGCAHWDSRRVEHHLAALADTFDAAAAVARTPFFFRTDITAAARPIAIDGTRELIRRGLHREGVFWIVATFARCHAILSADAPAVQESLSPAFGAVLADLGITCTQDLVDRARRVIAFLPGLWETAEAILRDNPGVTGSHEA